jgi:hypothetical protein
MDVHVVNGNTTDEISTSTNTTGVMDAIITLQADRGTWIRVLNHVAKGSESGLPVYMDLRDSNDDPLPAPTECQLGAKEAGMTQFFKVSARKRGISHWINQSIQDQQHSDYVDASKIPLEYPENHPESGQERDHIDITHTDKLAFMVNASTQWDPNNSRFHFDSNAVEQH